MYFVSEHSTFNETSEYEAFPTLIGTHENYLYSANSFINGLKIYRRKIIDTREWELVWESKILTGCGCTCSRNSVSAAFGIIENELFIAAYGRLPYFNSRTQLHLASINLNTFDIIDYKIDSTNIWDFAFSLCNQCCLSSIKALNPENPTEISIIPWTPEFKTRFSSTVGTITDCIQSKFILDQKTKTAIYLQSTGFKVCPENTTNQSNIGILEFGKIMYFKNDELILSQAHPSETRLKIVEDSDLHKCLYAGFYKNAENGEIYCMAFEESGTGIQQTCSIYSVQINEEKALAKFTKVFTFPRFLLPSDPRYSTFVMDSRMLIWSHQNQTFTYIFGTVSLSEASYISASNFHSQLFQEYQKLSESEEFEYGNCSGIFNESESFGLTQNQIKELLGLPKSFEFSMN